MRGSCFREDASTSVLLTQIGTTNSLRRLGEDLARIWTLVLLTVCEDLDIGTTDPDWYYRRACFESGLLDSDLGCSKLMGNLENKA
jgi:hypothetical protein